jgi:N-methylhydantoinase A
LSDAPVHLRIGIDTGGTFTDLLAWDGITLRAAKVPSTPGDFHRGVISAIESVLSDGESADLIHGSTVATNALLERKGHPIAFITTAGFADLLLIGRQNRPDLYALEPARPAAIVADENTFTVTERIDAAGNILLPLDLAEVDTIIAEMKRRGLAHAAVCLLFSFVNPIHEQSIGERFRAAGLTLTQSSELLPEFREYERGCAAAINATLRPNVETYLAKIADQLPTSVKSFRVMHSGGGTTSQEEAARVAIRLLLSGPAGGVLGASYVAKLEGLTQIITYDMGGTSTDVACSVDGKPRWTTSTVIDRLPIALPMFDIHTIGAGGGSIAWLDAGGALRVGPQSAGAQPGPACYGRGGVLPTVTDANLVLGRLLPDRFLGGRMRLDADRAAAAVSTLAQPMGKSLAETALGILRIAESNMAAAIRHVTARQGYDPRAFTLVSFGGAGGLHAAALAEAMDISRVLIPPHAGLLSALGMIVAPPVVDASKTVRHLGDSIDDSRLHAEYSYLSRQSAEKLAVDQTVQIEAFADCRLQGQSYEVTVPVARPSVELIEQSFRDAYTVLYGRCPTDRKMEIVTLRLRRIGKAQSVALPPVVARQSPVELTRLVLQDGCERDVAILDRGGLAFAGSVDGPVLLMDPDSTALVPPGWRASMTKAGGVMLDRRECNASAG